jgi:hypothetical protein
MPNLKRFAEQTTTYAKNQPQYGPMPAHKAADGTVTWRERFKVLLTGEIWHQILSFKKPLQPQKLLVDKPKLAPMAAGVKEV